LQEVGYKHGKGYLEEMMKKGPPVFLMKESKAKTEKSPGSEQNVISGYKFTDLAQMVCKVRKDSFLEGTFILSLMIIFINANY
jgi:hypothetical protein